jgi:hypothetical protein
MPMVFAKDFASTAIKPVSDFGKAQPQGFENPDDNDGSPDFDTGQTPADNRGQESRMHEAPVSRSPEELSRGFEQARDPNDGAPAHTSKEAHGAPNLPVRMPPDRPSTGAPLQGMPTHTSVQGPPLASSSARSPMANPRPILTANKTGGWGPRG